MEDYPTGALINITVHGRLLTQVAWGLSLILVVDRLARYEMCYCDQNGHVDVHITSNNILCFGAGQLGHIKVLT